MPTRRSTRPLRPTRIACCLIGGAISGGLSLLIAIIVLVSSHNDSSGPVMATIRTTTQSSAPVIIGGAGYAGVAAAKQLSMHGVDFTILEATDHVGGRMYAKPFGKPQVAGPFMLDAGANWVQGLNGNDVWGEAIRFGLGGNAQNFDDSVLYDENGNLDNLESAYGPGSLCLKSFEAYLTAGDISLRCLQPGSAANPPKSVDRRFCEQYFPAPFAYSDDDDLNQQRAQQLANGFLALSESRPAIARVCEIYNQDFEWAEDPLVTSTNSTLPPNTYSDHRDADYWVQDRRGGYGWLVKALAAEFIATSVNTNEEKVFDDPAHLRLFSKITEVHWDPSGSSPVQVKYCTTQKQTPANQPELYPCTAQEFTVTGDHFFSTFSTGVLQKSIAEERAGVPLSGSKDSAPRFQPRLIDAIPQAAEAIEKYPMAFYSKIFFQFEFKFWGDSQIFLSAASNSEWTGELAPVWQSLDVKGDGKFLPGSKILFVTVLGERARQVHDMTDAQIKAEFLPVLNQIFDDEIDDALGRDLQVSDIVDFSMTRWIKDPLTYGMYTNRRVDVSDEALEPSRQRYGNLIFSGEHSCFRHNGYTHGAKRGGERSARILLAEAYNVEGVDVPSTCDVLPSETASGDQGNVPPGQSKKVSSVRHATAHRWKNPNPPGHKHSRRTQKVTQLSDAEIDAEFVRAGSRRHE